MTHAERLVELLRNGEVLRHRDLVAAGIPAVVIKRCLERGVVERVGDDISDLNVGYALPQVPVEGSEHARLAAIAARHPRGVLCLHSALRLHELTDEVLEDQVIAIPSGGWRQTAIEGLRIVQWADRRLFEVGVEQREILGQTVRVTDPARTVLDCFRWRGFPRDDAHKALFELLGRRETGVEAQLLRVYGHAISLECPQVLPEIQAASARFVETCPSPASPTR